MIMQIQVHKVFWISTAFINLLIVSSLYKKDYFIIQRASHINYYSKFHRNKGLMANYYIIKFFSFSNISMHLSAAYYISHCSFIHAIIKENIGKWPTVV